jgi:hypothetical protein
MYSWNRFIGYLTMLYQLRLFFFEGYARMSIFDKSETFREEVDVAYFSVWAIETYRNCEDSQCPREDPHKPLQ